jgi:lipid A oxidase
MRLSILLLSGGLVLAGSPASAEVQFSVYGGANTNNDSEVTIEGSSAAVDGSYDTEWDGASFEMPPYWGLRGTYWMTTFGMPNWGVAIDYTHAKAKADLDDFPDEVTQLEFTDGLNIVTANALYRHPFNDRFGLYAGAGLGASIPHVELNDEDGEETFEYQVTGPAVQALAGATFEIGHGFSAFGEYKASYTWNDADLDGGGSLETDILTHHFALGISYAFGK